jgi:S-layer protein (TIGR01567 family)
MVFLSKNGLELDNETVSAPDVYTYTADIGGEYDVPVFSCYVDAVFRGTDTNITQVKYVFLIDDVVLDIDCGDEYGVMEVMTASASQIILENYNPVDLDTGTVEHITGDMYFKTADDYTAIRFYPFVEYTDHGTYEIRGTVQSFVDMQSTAITWNACNFGAFWYDLDDDRGTETLVISADTLIGPDTDRTIDENCLSYQTCPVPQYYTVYKHEGLTVDGNMEYFIEGWMGEKYVAINGRADKLCERLLEFKDDDKKTLATGEAWDLGGGFSLEAKQIDLDGNQVWLGLSKDGWEIDSEFVSPGEVYAYAPDIGGEDDVPAFSCYVDAVFRGTDTNIIQVKYIFLIDDAVLEIDTGDEFGDMEVTTACAACVILENEDPIELCEDSEEYIMGNLYFKTADNTSAIRFYPFVERTIGGDGVAPAEPATNVTIRVDEGIVLENDIYIELIEVGADMGWYARVWFYSYQDSVGEIETLYQGDTWHASYTSGTGRTIDVILDSAFSNGASFVIESSKELRVTERYNISDRYNVTISAADTDNDGVPDAWDLDNSTPAGYWVNSYGIGRMWGDMNGDGKLSSVDALMILQAVVGKIDL